MDSQQIIENRIMKVDVEKLVKESKKNYYER